MGIKEMNKSWLIPVLLLVLSLSCNRRTDPEDPPSTQPNILYILVDDLGYGDLNLEQPGLDGFSNPFIHTPNLAVLARESLVLTHHYAASPVCSPSRAGLLTGRTPTRLNINRWIEDWNFDGTEYLRDGEITLAELCRKAGYETVIYGKWHLNCADWTDPRNWEGTSGSFPNHQGFQRGMVSKENPHLTIHLRSNSQKNPGDFYTVQGQSLGTLKGYSSTIISDSALHFLRTRQKELPFFLYLPYDAPHERIYNPDAYDDLYQTGDANKDAYYGNVTHLDHEIGRVLQGLKEMGLEENTLIFFSSDNGPEVKRVYFGAWRSYGTSYPLHGQKRTLLEGGIRVPGMVKWKGHIQPGVSDEPNSTLDVFPTLCELLGQDLPADRAMDGASMIPHLLQGRTITRKKPLYWQYEFPENWETSGEEYQRRYEGSRPAESQHMPTVSIRSGDHVLRGLNNGRANFPERFEMYDLINDPQEEDELSRKMPDLFDQLKVEMEDLYREVNRDRNMTIAGY